jgi:hypothetical protein
MIKVTPILIENNSLTETNYRIQTGNKFKSLNTKEELDNLMNESLKTESSISVKSYNVNGFVKETKYINENNSWVEFKPTLNESYVKRFKHLVEYEIKPHVSSSTIIDEDDEDVVEIPDSKPEITPFEDTTAISQLEPNTLGPEIETPEQQEKKIEDLSKVDDITRIKEIQDQQSIELNNMLQTVDLLRNEIDRLTNQTADIPAIKANVDIVNKKVKELTPLTTEEQLTKNAIMSGGMRIEDVWNKYILNNEVQKAVSDSEENKEPELEKYSEEIRNLKNNNDLEIKKSFGLN